MITSTNGLNQKRFLSGLGLEALVHLHVQDKVMNLYAPIEFYIPYTCGALFSAFRETLRSHANAESNERYERTKRRARLLALDSFSGATLRPTSESVYARATTNNLWMPERVRAVKGSTIDELSVSLTLKHVARMLGTN